MRGEATPGTPSEAVGVARGSLGIYRHRETFTLDSPAQAPKNYVKKIEKNKDLHIYTDDEKAHWKAEKEKENYEKAKIARAWLSELGENSAVCQCGRAIKGAGTNLYLTENATLYHNHIRCRSWTCPLCAPKRAWGRTKEIEQALINAHNKGYKQLFITFTIPHTVKQKTATVLRHLSSAYHIFRNDRKIKKMLAACGFIGQIKSLDFTYTVNGCHAHYHTIYIFDSTETPENLAATVYNTVLTSWDAAVYKETGRHISRKYGLDIEVIDLGDNEYDQEQAQKLAEYTAKVISLYTTKYENQKGSISPFDLLDLNQEAQNKPIFQDYYIGTKGVRRLVFSRDLKQKLDIQPVEYERPAQAPIAYIAPAFIDVLRDVELRQTITQLIFTYRANEAMELLRKKAPAAPLFPSFIFLRMVDDYGSLFDTRDEQIRRVVSEYERLGSFSLSPD